MQSVLQRSYDKSQNHSIKNQWLTAKIAYLYKYVMQEEALEVHKDTTSTEVSLFVG
jgi:hypothetical protein